MKFSYNPAYRTIRHTPVNYKISLYNGTRWEPSKVGVAVGKIRAIKLLREISQLDLKRSKEWVETLDDRANVDYGEVETTNHGYPERPVLVQAIQLAGVTAVRIEITNEPIEAFEFVCE